MRKKPSPQALYVQQMESAVEFLESLLTRAPASSFDKIRRELSAAKIELMNARLGLVADPA